MALVKYGAGIVQASGSIAGTVYSRNRFGGYMRARPKPVNPRSDRQVHIRSIMQFLVEYWGGVNMDATKRGQWATYAAAITTKNRIGDNVNLTGFNHFIRSNAARIIVGGDIIEDGPEELVLPGADPTIAVVADAGTQLLTIAFDDTLPWASESGGYLSIEMGQPQNITRNFFGGPHRNAGGIAGIAPGGVKSPQELVAPFPLVTGQKIWVRAALIRADGRISNKFSAPAVEVGGLLPTYNCTAKDTVSPDCTCNYDLAGAFNGKAYFARREPGFFMWWDGTSTWYISETLGTPGEPFWTHAAESPIGTFTKGGTATGDVEIAAGEH
jgi:hypothetical protein